MDEADVRLFLRDGYARLVGAVALVTGDLTSAEDAVQEAIVRAWERSDRGEQIVALDRWVAAVAMNLSRSGLRRLRVERLARPRLDRRGHRGRVERGRGRRSPRAQGVATPTA